MMALKKWCLVLGFSLSLAACGQGEGNESADAGLDNTAEVEAYYQDNADFFVFATPEDLPTDLTWEDGQDLPDIGSPEARKGGTWHGRLQDFPRTLRLVGPDSNGSFRPYILDDTRMSFGHAHPQPGTDEFRIYPGIAEAWAVDMDTSTVYVRINPKARYSDGEPVTSDDVLFSFFFYRSSYIVAPWYNDYYTSTYTKVTRFDDHTFALTFPESKPDMAYRALNWTPMPQHFFKELGDDYVERYQWRFVPTTGAYVVHDKDIKKGRGIAIRRDPNWWAKDMKFWHNRYNFDTLRLTVIRDTPKAFEAFYHGDIDDFSLSLSEYWYDKLPDDDPLVAAGYIEKAKFYNVLPRPTYGLWVNESRPLLDNVDIRVGLNYAANFELVIDKFFRGDAVRMNLRTQGYGPLSHPTIKARPFDPDKAREHFAKAGFDQVDEDGILKNAQGQRLSFNLSTGYESLKDVITILKEQALKAGVELRLEVLDGTAGWKKFQEKKHDIHLAAFGVSYEQFPRFFEYMHSYNAYDKAFLEDGSVNPDRKIKPQTNNNRQIADYELDKLIDAYRASDDVEEKTRLSHQIQEIEFAHASFIPGWVQPFYRRGYWRWLRHPEGYAFLHSSYENEFYEAWIDEDMKKETLAAQESGETFPPQVNVYDQFKED